MRIPPKLWRILGIGLAVLLVAAIVVRQWVVPAMIARALESRYAGKVAVGGWWLGGSSSGITDLSLHEGPGADSPVWATAQAIETDLSLGNLLSGRVMPGKITLRAPAITFRLDESGTPLTKPPLKGGGSGSGGALPTIVVEDAKLTIDQKGRTPMVVTRVAAKLASAADGERLTARADDPTWGTWSVLGLFDSAFQKGTIDLSSAGVRADAEKIASLPFVPQAVWDNIVPTGPADIRLTITLDPAKTQAVGVHTVIDLKQTTALVKSLDLTATDTTGRVVIDGGVVTVQDLKGHAIGGEVAAPRGTLDFTRAEPTFDMLLTVDKVDVAATPAKWQLKEDGFTSGRMTGQANLKAVLARRGVDLSDTTGEATIEGATIAGLPVKSMRLVLSARGGDLKYDQPEEKSAKRRAVDGLLSTLIALQAPAAPRARAKAEVKADPPENPKGAGIRLPKSITTQIELEDVDLKTLVQRAGAMGIHIPVPVAGRLSMKARATIPLGTLREVKGYTFHGDASLAGASIDGVDLGNVRARLDLEKGVLDLSDFRGQLVDRPEGGVRGTGPPPATAAVPAHGPLPPGGFRGGVHAELDPPGRLSASFEGNALPLGELAAPALPRPTPLSGNLTFDLKADADLARVSDPKSWAASGHARSEHVTYLKTTLDAASTSFSLKNGTLDVPDLAANLGGKPLTAGLSADLATPYAFKARLDVADWDISDALTLVPGAPKPAPADGLLTIRAEAGGTLSPRDIQTGGSGRIAHFRAGAVPLGDVPFTWKTEGDAIRVTVADARPFGGHLSADAQIPAKGEGPIRGTIRAAEIDTAQMAAQIPGGGLKLTGKAGGTLEVLVPPHPAEAANAVEANLTLSAPDLTVQEIPAEKVAAAIWARKGLVHYDITADSLGGKIKISGDVPLDAPAAGVPPAPAPAPAPAAGGAAARLPRQLQGEVRAVGIGLGGLWTGLGLGHSLAPLTGEGAVDANVRVPLGRPGVYARAVAEARNLQWGSAPLGHMRATIAMSPTALRVTPLEGELLGGPARGQFWSETTAPGARRSGFDMTVELIDLAHLTSFLPTLHRHLDGLGTLHVTGRLDDAGVHAAGEADVPRAHLFGLPIAELRLPAEVSMAPGSGSGHLKVHAWSARVAGGRVNGDARFNLGIDRAFAGSLHLGALDLETLTRVETGMRRPATGRISGSASWSGRDYTQRRGLRGRIDLDLDDASLFEMPVLRELSRFLGSAQGGTFEDGDIHATLGDRELTLEQATLQGRLVQIHATGTIGYDQSLNLEVLVNTPQLISETGQALARLIPGLGEAAGRRDQAVNRVGNFLSNRLLKFRVTGTLRAPQVNADATVLVGEAAVGFFGGVLKLPLGLLR